MPVKLTRRQRIEKIVIPTIDLRTLGGKDTVKTYFKSNFIVLGKVVRDEPIELELGGMNFEDSISQVFRYTWCQPNDAGKLDWLNVQWADSLLRLRSGDKYDDPGYALGLTLKQEQRRKTPGLHGAKDGANEMFYTYTESMIVPVLWNISIDKKGNIDPDTGELTFLKLTPYQYKNMFQATLETFNNAQVETLKGIGQEPNPERMFLVEYVKDPNKPPAERNAFTVKKTMQAEDYPLNDDEVNNLATQLEIASKEYRTKVEDEESYFTKHLAVVNAYKNGQIEDDVLEDRVHAAIAEALLVGWGEIDENSGMSANEINELFISKIPEYTQDLAVTNSEQAVIDKTVIDLNNSDEDLPF